MLDVAGTRSRLTDRARPVRLLATGGTISMRGQRASPALAGADLVEAIPQLGAFGAVEVEDLFALPSAQLTLHQALEVARRASACASAGEGVVISTGTDTLEELAMLCALVRDPSDAPIVLTGANRTAQAPGADGPANLLDSVAVAASSASAGLGAVVVFAGEIHAATTVRKVDSTGPAAFGSPLTGPIGRVVGGGVWLAAVPRPVPRLVPAALHGCVPILTAALGDGGESLRAASERADGLVVVGFGAGHLTPGMLDALRELAARLPVVVTVRPERGAILHDTYGFHGSERDVRSSGALCAPLLSPVAARIALLCCIGANLDRDRMATVLRAWDV